MKIVLRGMGSTFTGFQRLISLHKAITSSTDPEYEFDMGTVNWIDANMCAPLAAVLNELKHRKVRVVFSNMPARLRSILQKNGFLPNFGFNVVRKVDIFKTTIEYQRFERSDAQGFKGYIERHFVGRPDMPRMSEALAKKFRESISEIFENAVDHSQTQHGIFACGQYFPKDARLDFSIADRGIGIQENIHRALGLSLSPEEAIAWALQGTNTTRRDSKPGGLGLKLIREFIKLNRGRLQIASAGGFWQFAKGKIGRQRFDFPFPGTVVNIEINTSDTHGYCLASEVDPSNVF